MKLEIISGRATVLVALLIAFVVSIMGSQVVDAKPRTDRLTLATASGQHVIEIEIAETGEDKSLGLMYRPTVPANTGMLFPYEHPQELTMWMRNTYASLDMVFIKSDGVVHRIEYGTEPLSERIIGSQGAVLAVLELAAGEARRLGLKPGDVVQHAAFKTKPR